MMNGMNEEERIADFQNRVGAMEKMDAIDKLKAKQERERRTAMKRRIKEEHHTIRVTRDGNAYRFAEPINDPPAWQEFVGAEEGEELYPATKWSRMIRDGVLHRSGDGFVVQADVAAAKGYEIVEVE